MSGYVADPNGLDHPESVAWVIASAKPVLKCKRFSVGFLFCPAAAEFVLDGRWTEKLGPRVESMLMRMLTDTRSRVRALTASVLARDPASHGRAMASAGMRALENERDPVTAALLVSYVGNLDLKATGLTERVKNVMRGHPDHGVRSELLKTVGRERNPHLRSFVIQVASDPSTDPYYRMAAAKQLPPTKRVCALWLKLAAEPWGRVSSAAARWLAGSEPCREIDELLTEIERRASFGGMEHTDYCEALLHHVKSARASHAQKKRALLLALTIARSSKNNNAIRGVCLAVVANQHPAGAVIAKKLVATLPRLQSVFDSNKNRSEMKKAHERFPWPHESRTSATLAAGDVARGPVLTALVVPSERGMRISHHAHCEVAEHGLVCARRGPRKPTGWKLARRTGTVVATEFRRGGVQQVVVVASNRAGAVTQITRLSAGKTVVSAQFFRTPGKRYTQRARTGRNVLGQCGTMELTTDARGRARTVTCLGWKGKPRMDGQGVMTSRITRDTNGFETARAFFDADKQPTHRRDGVHRLTTPRDKYGRVLERLAFDRGGKPALTAGCHRLVNAWADDGTLRSQKCLDGKGNAVPGTRNVTLFRFTYNATGCQIKVAHYDAAGKPVRDSQGAYARNSETDKWCRQTRSWCTNADGKPDSCGAGQNSNMRHTYDRHDNVTSTRYFDHVGKPSKSLGNEAFEKRRGFDQVGRVVRHSCFDSNAKKIECGTTGYHLQRSERDAADRLLKTTFEDSAGRPTLNINAASQRFRYDSYDRQVEFTGFDRAGNPTSTLGSATTRHLFDQSGRQFAMLMLDKHGNPAGFTGCFGGLSCPRGRAAWHAMRVEWSPRGHVLYNYFFDRHLQLIERVDCAKEQCRD